MALSVRSMRLISNGSGRAMTEILISDHADESMARESLHIRVTIPLAEINVRTAERAAMKRTRQICADIEHCLAGGGTSDVADANDRTLATLKAPERINQ